MKKKNHSSLVKVLNDTSLQSKYIFKQCYHIWKTKYQVIYHVQP